MHFAGKFQGSPEFTGFRWYVSFAWKFTHASEGDFENCTLLLEEPGIHLHYSGQRDLLGVFEDLSGTNTVMYTTHLSSMVDQANPARHGLVGQSPNAVKPECRYGPLPVRFAG